MTIDRRVSAGLIVAPAIALARPLLALGDTGPAPAGVPGPDVFDASTFAPYVGLAIVVLVVILAVRSPGSRRLIAALFVMLGSFVVAAGSFVLGAFSCFDCSSRPDEWKFNVGALVVLVVGLLLAFKILSGGRGDKSDPAAPSAPSE
jgi:hypothetical protein